MYSHHYNTEPTMSVPMTQDTNGNIHELTFNNVMLNNAQHESLSPVQKQNFSQNQDGKIEEQPQPVDGSTVRRKKLSKKERHSSADLLGKAPQQQVARSKNMQSLAEEDPLNGLFERFTSDSDAQGSIKNRAPERAGELNSQFPCAATLPPAPRQWTAKDIHEGKHFDKTGFTGWRLAAAPQNRPSKETPSAGYSGTSHFFAPQSYRRDPSFSRHMLHEGPSNFANGQANYQWQHQSQWQSLRPANLEVTFPAGKRRATPGEAAQLEKGRKPRSMAKTLDAVMIPKDRDWDDEPVQVSQPIRSRQKASFFPSKRQPPSQYERYSRKQWQRQQVGTCFMETRPLRTLPEVRLNLYLSYLWCWMHGTIAFVCNEHLYFIQAQHTSLVTAVAAAHLCEISLQEPILHCMGSR